MRLTPTLADSQPWWLRPFFAAQVRRYGAVLEPSLVWARSPRLFLALAVFNGALNRKRSPLPPALRALVTVRVSQLNWCAFCIDLNSALWLERGGALDKLDQLAEWHQSTAFSNDEREALAYAEAMTAGGAKVDEALVKSLRSRWGDDGVVELTALIAFQNLSSRFNAALAIEPQGLCQRPLSSRPSTNRLEGPQPPPPNVDVHRNAKGRMLFLAVMIVLGIVVALLWHQGIAAHLSFSALKGYSADLVALYEEHKFGVTLLYLVICTFLTALPLPTGAVVTLAAGAIFGTAFGTLWVSVASTLGATLTLLCARYGFREAVLARFGPRFRKLEAEMAHNGAYYLFSLRLAMLLPFFVVNLLVGLTPIRLATFLWVSLVGMLPETVLYANAGSQLARLTSMSDILSPRILASFAALGLGPLAIRKLLDLRGKRPLAVAALKP